jgi:hypothetical protein
MKLPQVDVISSLPVGSGVMIDMCAELGLQHSSLGDGKDRCINLNKTDISKHHEKPSSERNAVESAEDDRVESAPENPVELDRDTELRRLHREQQLQKKLQQQQQKLQKQAEKQRQQAVMQGSAFLLSAPSAPAHPASEATASVSSPRAAAVTSTSEPLSATESDQLLAAAPLAPTHTRTSAQTLVLGTPVRIHGLSTDWLNGASGVIASPLDISTGRFLVKIHAPKDVAVRCMVRCSTLTKGCARELTCMLTGRRQAETGESGVCSKTSRYNSCVFV